MRMYEVLHIVNIHSGLITLNADQARRRAHKLERVEADCYKILGTVQFKVGEHIGLDAVTLNGVQLSCLKDLEGGELETPDDDNPDDVEGPDESGEGGEEDDTPLEDLPWQEIKKQVVAAGGEWTNKHEGIEFLRLNAETNPDDDNPDDGD